MGVAIIDKARGQDYMNKLPFPKPKKSPHEIFV